MKCARLATVLVALAFAMPALAQTAPPPRFQQIDANGVDLISGRFVFTLTEGSIGSGDGEVSLHRGERNDYGRTDEWSGVLYRRTGGGTSLMVVQFGNQADTFTISGSAFAPTKANGATLTDVGGSYVYRASDGTTVSYSAAGPELGYPWIGPGCSLGDAGTCALPMSIVRPNGTTFTLNWDTLERCHQYDEELNCINAAAYYRFDGVTGSTGYSFTLSYQTDNPLNQGAPQSNWYKRSGATFTNSVSTPPTAPTVTYSAVSTGVEDVTDIGGGTWRISSDTSGRITGVRRPGSSSNDISVTYGTGGIVTAVTKDGVATNYSRSISGTTATTTITDALSHQTVVVADTSLERITSVTDPLSRTTGFQYDSSARLIRITRPEGNYLQYSYDGRGNLTETRLRDKNGNSASDIVATASYDSTCSNPIICNRPNSTTDARGNTTNYTWDSTHGGLSTLTLPAPSGSGDRPQTRYSYTLTNGEYRLTGISACQAGTASSCVGTADESRGVIAYDGNANVTSVEQRDGTGTLSATETRTFDAYGNLLTVDGPLTGDTIRYRYSMGRQVVGAIGPDPDAAGSLKHRAVRTTYRSDGLPAEVEQGTVNSQSDSDWGAFAALDKVQIDYDANDRPTVRRLMSGSSTYTAIQTSYDSLGRPQCVAQRMNPSEFATLPSDACTLDSEGSFGPDRILRTYYDDAGQVIQVRAAYAISGQEASETTTTYRSNGQAETVTDAEGNRTTYEYDAHDRLVKTRFPLSSTDNSSSTTDYEQLTLDANGNVTNRRLRDGTSISFSYDALNQITSKDLPGSEPTVSYTYDLLGRMTGASSSGHALGFTFDALGRNLSQSSPQGTASYQYDAAGRRTRLTYPGTGLYVDYDRLVTGEVTSIRENGASSGAGLLGVYAYDDRGRRTSLTRGNGTVTTYSYDNISRLTELAQNLNGTSSDLTLGMSYNPASQVSSNSRSNDNYAFTGHTNVNVTDTINGLNQVTATGGTSVAYTDARGNITAIGSSSYSYSSENLMVGAPGSVSLGYEPLTRLYQTVASGVTTRFAYDGQTLIAEYDGSNALQRRYVHGPGVDEPLVWYEGSGTSIRRWFHTDEHGSVISVSDGSGDLVGTVNRYDEYGRPQGSLTGRFGYTGQAWIPEAGLYYYRARMYNANLGRFMQPDPIGFVSGMNLYSYVGNDPVNLIDQLGLQAMTETFGSRNAAAQNATLIYFRRGGTEWGGGIYRYTDLLGNVNYFYTAQQLGRSEGRFFVSSSGPCIFYRCSLVAAWHTHNLNLSLVFSLEDRRTANRNRTPLYLGVNGVTLLFVPTGSGDSTAGGVFRVREPAPQLPFLYTLQDSIFDSWRSRFGPGGTIGLIGYLLHCIVGEVDICEGTGPGIGIPVDPREVSPIPGVGE